MYPSVSTLEMRLFAYLQSVNDLVLLADIATSHPTISGELKNKGRVTITNLYSIPPKMSRLSLDTVMQFACWDFSNPKARRLQEQLIKAIETMQLQATADLKVGTPVNERISGVEFSSSSQLYFTSVVYRFPLFKTI